MGLLPACSTFFLFSSGDLLGSLCTCSVVVDGSSPSCFSLVGPNWFEMGDCTDLVSGVSSWRDSLPRDVLIACDSGLLERGFVTLDCLLRMTPLEENARMLGPKDIRKLETLVT